MVLNGLEFLRCCEEAGKEKYTNLYKTLQSVLVVTARDVENVRLGRLEGRLCYAEQNLFGSFSLTFRNLASHI